MKKNALYSAIVLMVSALTLQPVLAQPSPPSQPSAPTQSGQSQPSRPSQPTAPTQSGQSQPSSSSNSQLIDATDPSKILEIAKTYGSAELKKDSDGDPMISATISGLKYIILFYGCKSGKDCDDIQFVAAWRTKVSLEKVNTWNGKVRYGKAHIDSDGEPVLKMMVNIDYGVSRENLKDSFTWWQKIVSDFNQNVIGQ
jgi:hypothetical protein